MPSGRLFPPYTMNLFLLSLPVWTISFYLQSITRKIRPPSNVKPQSMLYRYESAGLLYGVKYVYDVGLSNFCSLPFHSYYNCFIARYCPECSIPHLSCSCSQVLQVIFGALPNSIQEEVISNFSALVCCVKNKYTAVRHMSARALASCAQFRPGEVMNHILDDVLPLLGASHDLIWRQGAVEAIYRILLEFWLFDRAPVV